MIGKAIPKPVWDNSQTELQGIELKGYFMMDGGPGRIVKIGRVQWLPKKFGNICGLEKQGLISAVPKPFRLAV
jgi:hypothetical protein